VGESQDRSISGGTGKYVGARGRFVLSKGTNDDTPFAVELLA
jgi:hypothetical protein